MSPITTMDSATSRLSTVPMFADLSAESLRTLAGIVAVRRFVKGALIIGQDDIGTCMYLLTSGRVKVSLASPEGKELVLDYLEAPAHFGEMSLVDSQSRSADVYRRDRRRAFGVGGQGPVGGDPDSATARAHPHRNPVASPSTARSAASRTWLFTMRLTGSCESCSTLPPPGSRHVEPRSSRA